jgi:hypothetical protein
MNVSDDVILRRLQNSRTGDLVKRLLKNKRNLNIKNTGGAYYYQNPATAQCQILSGLLPSLRKTYYPQQKAPLRPRLKTTPRGTAKPPKRGRFYGLMRGSDVHKEVADYIFLDRAMFLKKHPSIHILTKQLMLYITEEMKWRPLRAEFDLYDQELRIGTSIDMICLNEQTGRLVLLELKTGYSDYWHLSDSKLLGGMHKLSNSPCHLAVLQLLASTMLLLRHHTLKMDELELYVLRIDEQGIESYKLDNQVSGRQLQTIYQDLLQQRQQPDVSKKTKKKATKR